MLEESDNLSFSFINFIENLTSLIGMENVTLVIGLMIMGIAFVYNRNKSKSNSE